MKKVPALFLVFCAFAAVYGKEGDADLASRRQKHMEAFASGDSNAAVQLGVLDLYGDSKGYAPNAAALEEAEKYFLSALDMGEPEAPFLLETLYLQRRDSGDAARIVNAYEKALGRKSLAVAARLFAIKKSGIYTERDENGASALLDAMYRQKEISPAEIAAAIASAYYYYAIEAEALNWFENAFREKYFDIRYLQLLRCSEPAKTVDAARAILEESGDGPLKIQAGAVMVETLISLGRNEEALKEAWRSLEYESALPFEQSRAPLYYALACDFEGESSQNAKIWHDVMIKQASEYEILDAVGTVFRKCELKVADCNMKALLWYRRSRDAKSPLANARIAGVYENSEKLRNIPLALEHYILALDDTANSDDPKVVEARKEALKFLYRYYIFGLYEKARDARKAIGYLEELAALKSPDALARLYVYKAEGFQMPKDKAAALRIYNEIKMLPEMDEGEAEARIAAAYRYARHETQSSNMQQLLNWLRRSSELGNASARFKLAIFLIARHSDEQEIRQLIASSASLGNIAAQAFVFVGRKNGGFFEKDEERAKLLYEAMLQKHGRIRTDSAISRCYERGMGVETNLELAKEYRRDDDAHIDEYFSDYL